MSPASTAARVGVGSNPAQASVLGMGAVGDMGHVGAEHGERPALELDGAADDHPVGRIPAQPVQRDEGVLTDRDPRQDGDSQAPRDDPVPGSRRLTRHRSSSSWKELRQGPMRGPQRVDEVGYGSNSRPRAISTSATTEYPSWSATVVAVLGPPPSGDHDSCMTSTSGSRARHSPTTSKGRPHPSTPRWTLKVASRRDAGRCPSLGSIAPVWHPGRRHRPTVAGGSMVA